MQLFPNLHATKNHSSLLQVARLSGFYNYDPRSGWVFQSCKTMKENSKVGISSSIAELR